MATKGAKETIVTKLGFKSSGAKSVETDLEKMKKENAQLKKTLDEMSKRTGRHAPTRPDLDRTKLLERILSLETLRQKNAQQLLVNEQEMASLRQQLRAKGGEVVSLLQNQLEQRKEEAEHRENQFQALSKETEDLKNKLVVLTEKCQGLEKRSTDVQVPSGETAVVQEQLRDALEKNQQWLVYDQQREAFVQGLVARIAELEQQLNQAKQALQENKAVNSEGNQQQQQRQVNESELVEEREKVSRLQAELKEQRARHDERSREVLQAQEDLQEERRSSWQTLTEERKLNNERVAKLQSELEAADARLEEERKRVTELLLQMNLLQKSLMTQQEDQKRITVLEQQVQLSEKDIENERVDRQSLQHKLHKVLKELRKARDQIAHLESAKQKETRFSEPSAYNRLDLEKMTIYNHALNPTSPVKCTNTLDESFLECPNCRALYPTSQHRELLTHLDYCFN